MPLSDILTDLAADLGLALDQDDEKTLAIKRVNDAAKELFEADDLIGSLREQVFDMSLGVQQVSLPYYVGEIRGIRYYDSRLHVTVNDMMPRYSYGIGNEVWPLQWRLLNARSPLARYISNQSILKFSINIAEDEDFKIIITGRTPNAHRATEVITFPSGTLSKQSINNYISVESIRKDQATDNDIFFGDVDNNFLGEIPNTELMSQYSILQILDNETANVSAVEVLYKLRYFYFLNDTDEFVVGNSLYDKAIYWKYLEHEYARNKDINGALAATQKCAQVCLQIANSAEAGIEKTLNFGPNPYMNLSPFAIPMFSGKYYPRHVSH